MRKRNRDFSFLGVLNCNSFMSKYVLWITFPGSLWFSGMALLIWLKKSGATSRGGITNEG